MQTAADVSRLDDADRRSRPASSTGEAAGRPPGTAGIVEIDVATLLAGGLPPALEGATATTADPSVVLDGDARHGATEQVACPAGAATDDRGPAPHRLGVDVPVEFHGAAGVLRRDGTSRKVSSPSSRSHGPRAKKARLEARRVHRLVRRVDLWSVLKLSLLFYLCAFLVALFAGVALWAVGVNLGVVADLEGFIREAFALQSFRFDGDRIFQAAVLGGLALVLAATTVTIFLAVLFNLMAALVGGVRVSVIEEETAHPVSVRGRSVRGRSVRGRSVRGRSG